MRQFIQHGYLEENMRGLKFVFPCYSISQNRVNARKYL